MTKAEQVSGGGSAERVWRLGRDINALGALAVGGLAAIIPGPNIVLAGWAGLNAAQAGGFELLRQNLRRKAQAKTKPA
jgi:hypothetical protein